jgi:AraC-like DNA-binding protein
MDYTTYSFDRAKFDQPTSLEVARVEDLRGYVLDTTPYRLDFHDITFVTAGEGPYWIDDQCWDVSPGAIIMTTPGRVRRSFVSGLQGIAAFFTTDFRGLQLRDDLSPYARSVMMPDDKIAADLAFQFEALLADGGQPFAGTVDVAGTRIDLILALIAYAAAGSQNRLDETRKSVSNRFIDLLDANYAAHHSPAYYADKLGFGVTYLSRLCREAFGRSARDVIHDRISLEARRQLVHSGESVQTIAYDLGFDDPSHFAKFFKRRNGVAPRQFRVAQRDVLWS